MWLLKFHIAASILCLLFCTGFSIVAREAIKENGWIPDKRKSLFKRIMNHWMYFIPIMNVISCCAVLMMITVKKSKYTEWLERRKENNKGEN